MGALTTAITGAHKHEVDVVAYIVMHILLDGDVSF
jgi:hypothetical protein